MFRRHYSLLLVLTATSPVSGAIDYVDLKPANTTLEDGTTLELVASSPVNPEDYTTSGSAAPANDHWHLRTGFAEGGDLWASNAGSDSPRLRTIIGGLDSGEVYSVYVYYWVAGFNTWPTSGGTPTGNNRWDASAGLDPLLMTDFGFLFPDSSNLEGLGDGGYFSSTVLTQEGNRRLFQARIGIAEADPSGTITVYLDDVPGDLNRTWLDGVGTEVFTSSVWDGEGDDGFWSTAANWLGDSAPGPGEELIFAGDLNLSCENDLPAGTSFAGITFDATAGDFVLSGNSLTLSGDISHQGPGFQEFDLSLILDGQRTVSVGGQALFFDGEVSGAFGLIKEGSGRLELTGTNTYTGGLTVLDGDVILQNDQSAADGDLILGPTSSTPVSLIVDQDSTAELRDTALLQVGNTVPGGFSTTRLEILGDLIHHGTLFVGRIGDIDLSGTWTQNGPASLNGIGGYSCNFDVAVGGRLDHLAATPFELNGAEANSGQALLSVAGTFATGSGFSQSTTPTTGFGRLTLLDGGVLELLGDVVELTTDVRMRLGDGGGMIDTSGFSTSISAAIDGPGGLTKAGTGSLALTGACTYLGDTAVEAGTLRLDQAFLADEANVALSAGASLELTHGTTDTIAGLFIDGVAQAAGIWGPTGSGAEFESALLTGSGLLEVVPSASFATWADEFGLSGDPDDDFDKDGLDDGIEYLFGTLPTSANPSPLTFDASGSDFVFSFPRDDASETEDISAIVEIGTDLANWPEFFTVGPDTLSSSFGVVVIENGTDPDTITVTVPKSTDTAKFGRLKVTLNP